MGLCSWEKYLYEKSSQKDHPLAEVSDGLWHEHGKPLHHECQRHLSPKWRVLAGDNHKLKYCRYNDLQ